MPFTFHKVDSIEGPVIVEPAVFADSRGYFLESFRKDQFAQNGIAEDFLQDNHSLSSKGTLRGLHFQTDPAAQGKLVSVITGAVWDVAVDLRKGSPTFGKWFGVELSGENHRMFYIPPGFAHGFLTLEDNTHFVYKCTAYYSPEHDGGIRWNDPDLAIDWPGNVEPLVSDKDGTLPFLADWQKEQG
ncbi:MAG: dTDP-4-dehydrorhamnose 3,5-epimerase [Spirochaetales bacterium]|nr:dTDP-4-dehydrorhamnose 3,5-epimerase [Spirochaetales bacterium]